jgi:G:T-mismatch repair DNA endonuclease (very short patch repair protein)
MLGSSFRAHDATFPETGEPDMVQTRVAAYISGRSVPNHRCQIATFSLQKNKIRENSSTFPDATITFMGQTLS